MAPFLPTQLTVVDEIIKCVQDSTPRAFFIDAPGCTGKTYLFNTILNHSRSKGYRAIAVASSGISACLLEGGRTFHSTFKAPLKPHETSTCNATAHSEQGRIIRDANIIIWDEAPMAHRYLLEALNRTLNDIADVDNAVFGNKVIVLGGDFRQCLPVVKHGSRAQIVAASLKNHSSGCTSKHTV